MARAWPGARRKAGRSKTPDADPTSIAAAPECRAAEPDSEDLGFDVTGRYQEKRGGFTFHINQAGKHIECWGAQVLTAKQYQQQKRARKVPREKPYYRLSGDFEGGKFHLYPFGRPSKPNGTLKRAGAKQLILEYEGGDPVTLVKRSKTPTISERAMGLIPGKPYLMRCFEWSPLVDQQVNRILDNATDGAVTAALKEGVKGSSNKIARKINAWNACKALHAHFSKCLTALPPNGWHALDLPLVRFHMRAYLALQDWSHDGDERPVLDWIQALADRTERRDVLQEFPTLRALGIRPLDAADREPITYKVSIVNVGGGIKAFAGIGLYGCMLHVQRTTPPEWEAHYLGVVGGVSAAAFQVGVDVGALMEGEVTTTTEWNKDDFAGFFTVMGGDTVGGVVGETTGLWPGVTKLIVEGSDVHKQLIVPVSTLTAGLKFSLAEVGVLDGYCGRISHFQSKRKAMKGRRAKIARNIDHLLGLDIGNAYQFRLASALLTEEARQTIRIFCATELALFTQMRGKLRFVGHTDSLGPKSFNDKLSTHRARNTRQAFKDILGDRLKRWQLTAKGRGETQANRKGEQEVANPERRRVDMRLFGNVLFSLRAE